MQVPKALTIAGTDPSGGAGIQADLKTFQELGVYGMSVITSVVSQNTTGVRQLTDMSLALIESQIDAVFEDIRPDAVKIGMLSSSEIIRLVVRKIKEHRMDNVVVDPVMIAKSGDLLLAHEAKQDLIQALLPVSDVITPNLPEAGVIVGADITSEDGAKKAAHTLVDYFGAKAAIVKGGHAQSGAVDHFYDGTQEETLTSFRFDTKHTHGTGCTFSSAIAAELAKGASVLEAAATAKTFIYEAISHPLEIGEGSGPVNHWAYQRERAMRRRREHA